VPDSPLTAPGLSGSTATTNLAPPWPGQPVNKLWTQVARLAGAALTGRNAAAALRGLLDADKRMVRYLDNPFPFKIYQYPTVLRKTPNPGTDWLKFRVRAGSYLLVAATGTDSDSDFTSAQDPDSEYFPAENAATEIIAPSNLPKFWFWLEISTASPPTAQVRWATDPTQTRWSSSLPNWTTTNPWTAFPAPDTTHIPIGWVDTQSFMTSNTPVIRQLQRTDITTLGGGGVNLNLYTLVSVHNNYTTCTPVLGGASVKIAMPPEVWSTITTQTMPDGTVINYSGYDYTATQSRAAVMPVSGLNEAEYICPAYCVGDTLRAEPIANGQLPGALSLPAGVGLLETSPRHWAGLDSD